MAGRKTDNEEILVRRSHQLCSSDSYTCLELFHVSDLWLIIFFHFLLTHMRRRENRREETEGNGREGRKNYSQGLWLAAPPAT